jgi:flagellar motor switch protein FliM
MSEQELTNPEAEILRMMAAGGRDRPSRVQTREDIQEYDFLVPHRFTPGHLRRLREFGTQAARNLTASLSAALRGAFPISLASLAEQYVEHQSLPEKPYNLILTVDGETVGFLTLSIETAAGWVTQLLGGLADNDVEEGRTLSALEVDLLMDLSDRVVKAVSNASRDYDGPVFEHDSGVTTEPIDLAEEGRIAEVCHLNFQRTQGEKTLPFTFVLLSPVVEAIAGLVRPLERSAEEMREDMLAHVESVHMPVVVRLDDVNLTMREIASLEEGDVILLPNPIEQPIDVIACGKAIMTGRPVQYRGRYGLQILTTAD